MLDGTSLSCWCSNGLDSFCLQIPVHCHLSNSSALCNPHAKPCAGLVRRNAAAFSRPSRLSENAPCCFSALSSTLPRLKLVQKFSRAEMESIQATADMS